MPAVPLLPPLGLDLVPALLRRRFGVEVGRDRLREAAAAGRVPARREGRGSGRWLVDEADLGAIAAHFRDRPPDPPHRRGAGAVPLALARGAGRR